MADVEGIVTGKKLNVDGGRSRSLRGLRKRRPGERSRWASDCLLLGVVGAV